MKRRQLLEVLLVLAVAVNSLFLGAELAQATAMVAVHAAILACLFFLAWKYRLYLRGLLFCLGYFLCLGFLLGEMLRIYYLVPNIAAKVNALLTYYYYIFVLTILYLPLYKLLAEPRELRGKIIDAGQEYYVVELCPTIFSGLKPGVYAVKRNGTNKYIGDEVVIIKDFRGRLKVKA
ncbi:MAG: hypothetical protein GXO42_00120 [bacterium]|nr:hypothetical protein [bacterium]